MVPLNEAERLAAVRRYDILDTPPDGAFDRITALASRFFNVPIAIVSIVDHDRIWFKSHHGLEVQEIGREPGLCASAILQEDIYAVLDAKVDPRTLSNPLVAGDFGLRFYAAAPLVTSDRYRLGTVCVLDNKPRHITEAEKQILQDLADIVMDELEMRLAAKKAVETEIILTKQALEATRAKSEFLATMSHEIRTPMNGVIGMAGLLLDTELSPQQRNFAETIRSSADTLLTIINDILDFSKIESGKLELEEQPVNLQECIESALDLVAPATCEKGLELAYLIEPGTPSTIIGDVTRLRQILVNLLSNAVKFTKTGEVVVTVSAKQARCDRSAVQQGGVENAASPMGISNGELGDADLSRLYKDSELGTIRSQSSIYEIQFAVKDTGIGIPSDRMHRLFKSFSQVDSATTREYGGTGLGLAISQRLSQIMGGKMWVESRGVVGGNPPDNWEPPLYVNPSLQREGSSFYFTLVASSSPDCPLVELNATPQLTEKRLLIVDDNATNRQILTLQAQSWGMVAQAASSGEEALGWLREGQAFDMALLDMQMPKMDGLTLATEIRLLPNGQDLPLVMLTSLGRQEKGEIVDKVKFAAYLTKPIKQSQLYNAVTTIFASVAMSEQRKAFRADQGSGFTKSPSNPRELNLKLSESIPLRILLAEDHRVNQQLAVCLLQQLGYRADVAGNGLEVLESLHRQPYDVVLMDVQMPEMDGLEATRQICQEWPLGLRPRIIAMTANAMQGDRQECLDAGMDDYISKPFRMAQVVEALKKCQPISGVSTQESSLEISSFGQQTKDNFPLSTKQVVGDTSIDREILQEFCQTLGENSSHILTKLIDCYLEDAPKLLEEMITGVEQRDAIALNHASHTLKSSSAALGATNLANLCKKIEAMARCENIHDASVKVLEIKAEYERVKAALNMERHRSQV
jgi:signal transduction histidine kinase/DNA-binding response OmpR family regulator